MAAGLQGDAGVLVDRDGTLIRDVGYLSRLEQMEFLPRVPEAIRLLGRHGFKIAVVTNQSGVGRGLLNEEELERIHRELENRLAAAGARVDRIYYCPHHPTEAFGGYRIACDCRKPDIGLARRAAAELSLDLTRCYVVGDQPTDMELAARIGARGIWLQNQRPQRAIAGASLVAPDLWEAAHWIVEDFAARR
ncbi:MAG TPA: HAD family hydrolase [Candidatus Binatia bacterium]|jgi:D-glycero-D-manno-heptose 1,7-bisphosphate phosphatase